MSFRRYAAGFVAMTCVGLAATTYFLNFNAERRGKKVMTTQNYVADSLKKHPDAEQGIDPEVIQAEVDKMLEQARQRGDSFEMKRIPRPDEAAAPARPQRFDHYDPDAQPPAQQRPPLQQSAI